MYRVRVWYRYGDEKDFEIYIIKADNESEAKRKACDLHKGGIIYKTEII